MVSASRPLGPVKAIVYGALVVGALDLLDALVFFGLRGAAPIRICQSIAAGLLGRAAFQGGAATAALGVALHFFIATCVVVTFYLASQRLPVLVRHSVIAGLLYGLAVYGVMNYIVIPLSALGGRGPFVLPVFINGLLIHAFGVGLPAALFVRAAHPPRTRR
jgi:hypothetical protein